MWEYWGEFHSQKDLVEFYGGAGSYTPWTIIDSKAPKKTVGISAKGVPLGAMLAIQNSMDSPGLASFSLVSGGSVRGIPVSFSATPIEHTDLYNLKVSLRVDGTSTPLWHAYGTESYEQSLTEFHEAPSGGSWGNVTLYSLSKPKHQVNIVAEGVDEATSAGLLAMMAGPTATGTFGGFTGIPISISREQIKNTSLYNVHVTLRVD